MQRLTDLKPISNGLRACHAMLYSLTTFIGLVVCCPGIRAQGKGFIPNPEDSALMVSLSQQYEQQYKEECGNLPSHYRKDYLKVYDDRWKSIKDVFDRRGAGSRADDYLFGSEDFGRIGEGEFQRLKADGEHGDRQGDPSGQKKYHSPDGDTISEVLQPAGHHVPCYR